MPMTRRTKYKFSLAAALSCVVLLASVALAVTGSGILERLFPAVSPAPDAARQLVTLGTTDEQAGLTLTLDEYLYDGHSAHWGWTVTSAREEPVYLLTAYDIQDDGTMERTNDIGLGSYGSSGIGDNVLALLDGPADARAEYAGFIYGTEKPQSPIKITVTVYAFSSPLEIIDAASVGIEDHWDIDEDVARRLSDAGQIALDAQRYTRIDDYPAFIEAYDPSIRSDWADVKAHGDSGLMQPLATLSASVTIDPVDEVGIDYITEPLTLDMPHGQFVVKHALLSPASTVIDYEFYPTDGDDYDWDDDRYRLVVTDERGTIYFLSGNISTFGTGDRTDRIEVSLYGNPAPAMPEALRLIPITEGRADDEAPEAYHRRLIDAADDDEILIIPRP